jgi:hypothetical protein
MMIVVMIMMLAGSGLRRSNRIGSRSLGGNSAGEAEASAGRERASAAWAGVGGLIGFADGGKVVGSGAARHAMDGFHGCGYGLGIRLRPTKTAGEPLKKIVDAAGFQLIVLDIVPQLPFLPILLLIVLLLMGFMLMGFLPIDKPTIVLRFLRTAKIRDFAHGNLMVIVAIVGEFCRLGDDESYTGLRIGGNAVAERRAISPKADGVQNGFIFPGSTAFKDEGAVNVSVGSDNEADADAQIVVVRLEEWVGGEQGFWRTNVSAFWQSERLGHGWELGDVGGNAAQSFLDFG